MVVSLYPIENVRTVRCAMNNELITEMHWSHNDRAIPFNDVSFEIYPAALLIHG